MVQLVPGIAEYVAAGGLGLLLGIVELISRYRDDPLKAVLNAPAAVHAFVNFAAAVFALFLIGEVFQLSFNITPKEQNWETKLIVIRILTAGIGAAAFFRSSLFVFRVGDKDIQVGPGVLIQVLLDVSDRAVDRLRASPRAERVGKIMAKVDFVKAQGALPTYCFALMQNVPANEQDAIAQEIAALAGSPFSAKVKSLALGLALMNVVGDGVLEVAVNTLGTEIQ